MARTLCDSSCFVFLSSISATFTKAANGNSCSFLFMKFNITQKSAAYPLAYLNCLTTFVVSSRISSITLYSMLQRPKNAYYADYQMDKNLIFQILFLFTH